MKKIKLSDLSAALLALSAMAFALRGKIGAIFITLSLLCNTIIVIRSRQRMNSFNLYAALFLFVFAFVLNTFRSLSPQYYLIIGYLAASVLLLESSMKNIDGVWKWLKGIAIFEATGVYLQWIIPELYYSIITFFLPNEIVYSIRKRLLSGYYTGFSREVSYTMFFIVVGLGILLFLENQKKRKRSYLYEAYLFGALLVSGKRATLLFSILAAFVLHFIRSRNKFKILKYTFRGLIIIIAFWGTYPMWSKMPVFSRFTEIIQYFSIKDMTGLTNGRTEIYSNAIQLWNTNPWFGIGWGNFKYSVSNGLWYSGFDVHNCFLQVLCETGIVGAVFFVILCIISIFNCSLSIIQTNNSGDTSASNKAVFCGYIQIFFILYSLTEPILYEYTDYIIFFSCFTCTSIMINKHRKKKKIHNRLLLKE